MSKGLELNTVKENNFTFSTSHSQGKWMEGESGRSESETVEEWIVLGKKLSRDAGGQQPSVRDQVWRSRRETAADGLLPKALG